MRIFLINLARRPDRLAAMTRAAGGLPLRRIEAVDARDPGDLDGLFEEAGPLGEIPRGDKACLLSHRAAWQEFVASGEAHATFLEDDVILTPSAGRFLGVPDAIAVIEQAQGAKRPDQIFRAYQGCPDTTLHPATEFSGLFLQAAATGGGQVHMVLQDTKLSALLQLYAGNDLHWIACRGHSLGRQQAVEDLFPRVAW